MSLYRRCKEPAKYLIFSAMAWVGRCLPHSATPILTYHSIDGTGSPISKQTATFRAEMEFLAAHGFQTVSLETCLSAAQQQQPLPPKSFVITFDDGFQNVYDVAWPILDQCGFQATTFLVTDFVGKESCWEVSTRIQQASSDRLPLMSWDQAQEMKAAGHSFGSHTASHPRLSQLPLQEVHHQLRRSKDVIEDKLDVECRTFCYPYGDCSEEVCQAVKDTGFDGAVTIDFGLNNNAADPYRLRRVGSARFTSRPVFEACIYGTYGWHQRSKKN